MNYNKIINPNTGRKVSIYSNLGKHILKNYIYTLQEGGSGMSKSNSDNSNYSEMRAALDRTSDIVKRFSAKRSANKDHYIPQQGTSIEQTWEYPSLSKKQIKAARREFNENFNIIDIDLDIAKNLLDQGGEGACSFVGFLNCCILSGRKNNVKKAASQSKWKTQWRKVQGHLDTEYGSPDIAATLDAMKKVKILNDDGLIYVPIRSAGAREQNFNISFWADHNVIIDKYNITEKNYKDAPFIYQNMFLLESLVDQNIPVAVNALEHTRTLIGYNNDKFIFADNWGHSTMSRDVDVSTAYSQLEDNFVAGYSTVKKWAIATNVRDIAYWN